MTDYSPINVIAIIGSTRKNSSNHLLVNALQEIAGNKLSIIPYDDITQLPHFNPDLDTENAPPTVYAFRQLLRNAEGIIICTPEYAHGVPGSLKNAIDWTVSSSEFSQKPTLLITASTDGKFGHRALLETLQVLEAKAVPELQLLIPFIRTKINTEGTITDQSTLFAVQNVLQRFINCFQS